ncbi:unnamed protein product [Chrysoparadoxa australica]
MSLTGGAASRTSLQLYRDCLKLVSHVSGKSAKSRTIRSLLRKEFEKNRSVEDPETIEALKGAAIRGLSNYFLQESAAHDPVLKERMESMKNSTMEEIKHIDSHKRR